MEELKTHLGGVALAIEQTVEEAAKEGRTPHPQVFMRWGGDTDDAPIDVWQDAEPVQTGDYVQLRHAADKVGSSYRVKFRKLVREPKGLAWFVWVMQE